MAVAIVPGEADACHESKICVEIPVSAADQPVGDFGVSETVVARGTRVRLVTPGAEGVTDVWLDDEGCFTYESRYRYGLKLQVFPEAFLGVNADVRIRGFDDRPAAVVGIEVSPTVGGTIPWRIDIDYAPAGNADSPLVVHVNADDMADMFGWLIESFYNVDGYAGITGSRDILVHTEIGDAQAALGAYNSGDLIMLGPIARNRKFIVAHEFGHWYQSNWTGLGLGVDYLYEDNGEADPTAAKDADCDFQNATNTEEINDLHGLRSAEYSAEAMSEGYAQFMATLAFNIAVEPEGSGEGEYQYYKEIIVANQPSYADLVDGNYMVSLLGGTLESTVGGRSAWVQNMCPADWNHPLLPESLGEHVSSEIDWMRFFWGFIADPDPSISMFGTPPDLRVVLDLFSAAGTLEAQDQYGTFEVAINNPSNASIFPFAQRFESIAIKNGVKSNE